MGSQLKEQINIHDSIFDQTPSFDWSMLCFKRFANLPIAEILKRKNCPLPSETSNEITPDEVYELDFIRHDVRLAAYCLNKGLPYLDDTLGVKVHALLETNPELIEYCQKQGICLYDINSHLVIGVTNKDCLNELNRALNNSVSDLESSPLKETLESMKTSFLLIGVSVEHTDTNLKNIQTQNADPNLVLDDIFSPLLHVFEYSNSVNASFFRFELNPISGQVTSIQAFEHERSYCDTSINPSELPKLAFALKQLDNRFKAVSSAVDADHFLNITIPNSGQLVHCRSQSHTRNDGIKIIFIEIIRPCSDDNFSIVRNPISVDMTSIREELAKSIQNNQPLILSVPKNRCIRFINNYLVSEIIQIYKQGSSCIVINHNYFRYTGKRLINLDETEIINESFMQNQFANAVIYGALSSKQQIDHVTQAIDNFQTIVAVTHASKSQLPLNLQNHTKTIE